MLYDVRETKFKFKFFAKSVVQKFKKSEAANPVYWSASSLYDKDWLSSILATSSLYE